MSEDRALPDRLASLAAAVPVRPSSPTAMVRRPVRLGPAFRPASGRSWVLVALVAVLLVAAVGILGSGGQPAYGPVAETVRQGDFELTLRADKGRYAPGEPIEIEASLTYRGPDGQVELGHASGAGQSPLGFGMQEPVLGDLRLSPGWDEMCVRTQLTANTPLEQAFQKSAGWSGLDPRAAEYRAWVEDPELRLDQGTWHVFAVAEFRIGDCGPAEYQLRAEIAITVESSSPTDLIQPSPTEQANLPQSNTVRDGDFELTIRSGKTRYTTDEPVDVSASLVYRGPKSAVDIWLNGIQIRSRERRGDIFVGALTTLPCPSRTLERDIPLESTMRTSRETPGRIEIEPIPLLPAGTWRLFVVARTCGPPSAPDALEFDFEAELTIEVAAAAPPPIEIANPTQTATDRDGDFELTLRSHKTHYAEGEAIELTTWLTYVGSEDTIEIRYQGGWPLVVGIREPVYGVALEPMKRLGCSGSTLQRGVPVVEEGLTVGFRMPDGPAAESLRALIADPTLRLPAGTWHLYAWASTSCLGAGPTTSLEVEVTIVVGDDPLATPGFAMPTPLEDTGHLPVSDERRTDDWRLILSSARAEYRTGEPISVTVAISYVGPEPSIETYGSSGGRFYFGVHEVGGVGRGTTTGLHTDYVFQSVMKRGVWEVTPFPAVLDPWLPPGTWELSASTGAPELTARIVITVTE